MEKAMGILLLVLLIVGVSFVQAHYFKERQRAKAECERLEQSIGQMQKQYADVTKQNQSYRQMNHELKKYQWLVQVMRESMGTVTHGQLLELVLQKKIQEAEQKQIVCDVQGKMTGNLRMDEMALVSLIMNLLDNAIEAAANAGGEKYIFIKISAYHKMTVVHIENSCGKVKWKKRMPVSDKGKGRGIGLLNVKQSIDKYDGDLQLKQDGNRFVADLFLNS